MIRILCWNVNGIRAAEKKGFSDWLLKEQPDICCVQETKAHREQVPKKIVEPPGYRTIWHSAEKKGYSGVLSFVKREPLAVRTLGIQEFDAEGRVQVLDYKDFSLINAYFPNSQPERARLDYKLAFNRAMLAFCDAERKKGKNIVLCGDYNVAHQPIDLARPKQNEDSPGYYIEEREAMTAFLEAGYVDTFRHFHPDEPDHYSWWSYRARSRERNVGWRIDYFCVNGEFMEKVKSATILPHVMGSDHCPVGLDLGIDAL